MTMKSKSDVYAEKGSEEGNKKRNIIGEPASEDESSVHNQQVVSSLTRAGSITGSECELKSSSGSSSDGEPNTFEGLLKICGEAGKWQLQVSKHFFELF